MRRRNFESDFDRQFARTGKTIKRVGIITGILALVQILFVLAVMAGIIYFIVFAITHWLRW
jgi:hypothetical protein